MSGASEGQLYRGLGFTRLEGKSASRPVVDELLCERVRRIVQGFRAR